MPSEPGVMASICSKQPDSWELTVNWLNSWPSYQLLLMPGDVNKEFWITLKSAASVVAIDNRPEGRALASNSPLKADLIIDSNDGNALEKIESFASDGGLPGIVVSTDNVLVTAWSLKTLRRHGVCVPLGLPVSGFQFDAFDTVFQALTIKGSLASSIAQIRDMIELVDKFGVRLTPYPSRKLQICRNYT